MFQRTQLKEGMTVRSFDGEKLGRVFALGDDAFHIEKGLFFPKDYLVRYAEVSDIRDGEIILMHGRESLLRLSSEAKYGTTAGLGTTAGYDTTSTAATDLRADTSSTAGLGLGSASADLRTGATTARRSEEIAIPVHKEELDVTKREVQAGEVRVHKDVVVEEKTVTVPVRRERVRVERRDVNPDRPAMNASFQEETVTVPLRAEEVDVSKRAVVDEEVIIHKDEIQEERRVSEPLRHETVDIRTSGEDDDKRSLNLNPDDDPLLRRR
ncbi:YsnF/AvaK domain-containing protein [Archangium sp.]|jgi:uncharacterized protein (TIGR02271 family)|uniref:YsnF/AvaK domain-containing protein n=1 Tax=Archangium sp. TaxID=1872627 RepID=UPI002ED951F3